MNPQDLLLLVTLRMPFGKYKDRLIADLPGHYLNWFARTGFDLSALNGNWVIAYAALVVLRFILGGLKMIGFFKELS